MDYNSNDSGSRVTRSLRKRLSSVDTDNSSRPGTPVPLKLTSISEISASPSRPTRMTRRNSTTGTSTPVKTPAKRGATTSGIMVENIETLTPARRSTRRRSVSAYENEETQISLKIPVFTALDEETVPNNEQSGIITHPQSKSPQQFKLAKSTPSPKGTNENKNNELVMENENSSTIQKRRKPGPKCKTQGHNELQTDSDVEISVLGNDIENIKNKSSNITTIVLTDDESNQTAHTNHHEEGNVKSVLNKIKSKHSDAINNVEKEVLNKNELKIADNNMNEIQKESVETVLEKTNSVFCDETNNEMKIKKNNKSSQLDEIQKDNVESITDKNNSAISDGPITETKVEENNESLEHNIDFKNCTTNIDQNLETPSHDEYNTIQNIANGEAKSPKEEINNDNLKEDNQEMCTDENNGDVCLMVQVSNNAKNEVENNVKALKRNETPSPKKFIKDFSDTNSLHLEKSSESEVKEQPFSEKIEIISVSTLTPYLEDSCVSDCKVQTKKVDFTSSPSNDMTIKNVYPKTPASAKTSNSFVEINSSHEDSSFQIESNPMPGNEINQKVEDTQLETLSQINTKITPMRVFKCTRSLETVQSSTPINVEGSKYKEMLPETEKCILKAHDEKPPINNVDKKPENTIKEEIMWINPSVKGTTVVGSKLDVVVTSKCSDNIQYPVQQVGMNKKKSIIFSSEEEEEEEDIENAEKYKDDEDGDGDYELAPGEKPYNRKHDFHDDEAMEVDDYESGDSIDSEERKEIEENEIPIYGESIGSHTTEDEHEEYSEEEDSENADSFIVSDNEEELECSESNDENERLDEDIDEELNRKKKKTYKRLQRPAVSSSSSDEEVDTDEHLKKIDHDCSNSNNSEKLKYRKESSVSQSENDKLNDIKSNLESLSKFNENILDSSKLSDSALRLQCTAESESEGETNEIKEEAMNVSRKEILRKLNQSDRFNKSVRDLNPEAETSPVENLENQFNVKRTSYEQSESLGEEHDSSTSTDETANKKEFNKKRQSESHLGEVSVTSESDADKEKIKKSPKFHHQHKCESGLSVSLGNFKKEKNNSKGRKEWQRSFTIDVAVKDGELEAIVTDLKLQKKGQTLSSPPPSSPDEQEQEKGKEEHKSEEKIYIDSVRHIPLPLGNPLIRTRRQSLALPTNPDMEICSSSHGTNGASGKKLKRKSLGVLSSCEYNPSQSFIDSIELHKNELIRQIGKRKRLSQSFCGASESHDNSIVDIDVRHLHKRSKLIGENRMMDSHHDLIENINSSKLSNKDKKIIKTDSNNIQHILSRCDEILEAANRAKLEAKLNNKKNQGKASKKIKKKSTFTISSNDNNSDDVLRKLPLEIKRKDRTTKTILSQAIKAANVILGKNKHTTQNDIMDEEINVESKRLSPDVLKAIEESQSTKKKVKKEFRNDQKNIENVYTASTSAGNFVELPQTPEKKKKKTFIQLPTGKVSIEPVTPQKRSVLALNGAKFRESPITPYAVGFKVRQVPILDCNTIIPSAVESNIKRKRCCNENTKDSGTPKSQWTQSGLFIEEVIPKNRRMCVVSNKLKKQQIEREENNSSNFKENAMMRPDIKRGNKRENVLLKGRRQVRDYY